MGTPGKARVRRVVRAAAAIIVALACALIGAVTAHATDHVLGDEIKTSVLQYAHPIVDEDGNPVLGEYGNPLFSNFENMPVSTDENGKEYYDIDLFDHPDWLYRLHAEYTLRTKYLSAESRTVIYQLPKGFDVASGMALSGEVKSSDGKTTLGTYSIDAQNNTFVITFNDATVKANATSAVDGWLNIDMQIDEGFYSTGGEIDLPGSGVVVVVGKSYSIDVDKQHGNFDETARTLPYTVTIFSNYGTPGLVHFTDAVQNATIDFSTMSAMLTHADGTPETVGWCDADGKPLTVDEIGSGNSIDAYLPRLEAGETVTLTYTVKDPPISGNSVKIANDAHVSSTNAEGQTVSDEAKTEYWYDARTNIWKNSEGVDENGRIRWKVEFNDWHKNLKGWTLSDLPGDHQAGELSNLELSVRNADGSWSPAEIANFSLPYTFTENDTNHYRLTYTTTPVGDKQTSYSNTAKLCAPDSVCAEASATHTMTSPFSKTAGNPTINTENTDSGTQMTATLPWTLTIGSDTEGVSVGDSGTWTLTDTLKPIEYWRDGTVIVLPHSFTTEQKQQLESVVTQAFEKALTGAKVDITFTETDGKTTGFTITCDKAVPAGTKIVLNYASTFYAGVGNYGWLHPDNCVNLGSFEACASSSFDTTVPDTPGDETKPTLRVEKMDGDNWQSGDTSHNYDDLKTQDDEKVLNWAIDIHPPETDGETDLVITEHLPEGTHLHTDGGLLFRNDSNAFADQQFEFDDDGNATLRNSAGDVVATAQWNDDTKTATITLKPAFWQGITITKDTTIRLTVLAGFDDAPYQMNNAAFKNTVTAAYGDHQEVSAEHTQRINRDAYSNLGNKEVMNKVPQYDTNGSAITNKAVYQLSVNPKGICVGAESDAGECSPARLTFDDVMTYKRELGYDNGELVLDPDSIHVYTPVSEGTEGSKRITRVKTNSDGTALLQWCNTSTKDCQTWNPNDSAYEPVPQTDTITVRELTLSEYSYTISADHPTTLIPDSDGKQIMEWTNTLKFDVPNQLPLIIDYSYTALADHVPDDNGNPQEPWIHVNNKMTLHGKEYAPADDRFAVNVKRAAAGADTTVIGVTVRKVDAENNGKLLDGAKFTLEAWDSSDNKWVELPDYQYAAAENGILSISNLTYNRAYRLTETCAPSGYALAAEPLYFVIDKLVPKDGELITEENYPWNAPSDFAGRHISNSTTLFFENSAEPIILPSAGGSGSARIFVLGGFALLAVVLACAVVMLKRPEISGR